MDLKARTCKICKKPCTEPKFLPCLHAFCKLCLKFQITQVPTNRQWEGFSCPSCNRFTKAIDPDQPLGKWADQFPDSLLKSKPIKKYMSVEGSDVPDAKPRRQSDSAVRYPVLSGSDSPGLNSPTTPGSFSPGLDSPRFGKLYDSQNSADLSVRSVSTSESEISMSPSPFTPTSPGVFSLEQSDITSLGIGSSSKSFLDDSVGLVQDLSELSVSSPTPVRTEESTENEQKMCTIHLWKPVILTCQKCNSIACGQCLVETHPTCKGEDFVPLDHNPLLPNISGLEEEVQKVDQVNDMITSSAQQLQQTREMIRQKIKQIALLLIQKMKKEEEQMVKKVEQLYHDEIWRLKSGINPSENLLKQVQSLKERTEDLSKQHPAAIVLQADSLQEEHKELLDRVKAVDYSCVPPEISFVPNFDTLALTLGDLVVDEGYYPKHDIPPEPVQTPVELPEEIRVPETQSTVETPETPVVSASGSKTKGSVQPAKQKSKSRSIFDKIRSPKQKQSKLTGKIPEL